MAPMEAQEIEHQVRVSEPTDATIARTYAVCLQLALTSTMCGKGQAFGPTPCDFSSGGLNPFTLPHM
jgi:hypothetical protein